MSLEGVLVAVAGFVSTLASNGSSVTLPALDLPEHGANGSNRLSVVALGLVGAFIAVDLSDEILDAIVIAGLVLVLGSGFFMLAALVLLTGYDLRHGNAMKAFILLVVGLQSLFVFAASSEVDWSAGVPLALGSAVGAQVAARLVTQERAKVWVYRLLVVVPSIVQLLIVDSGKCLQHT